MRVAEKIEQAQAVAQSGAIELVRQREVRVLDMLVSAHRGNKLLDRDAAVGIATIAALRQLRQDMEGAVRQGTDAGHSLTGQP